MCSDYVEPEQSDEPVDENEDDGVYVLDLMKVSVYP